MAEFKGMEASAVQTNTPEAEPMIIGSLYGAFDPLTEGGLVRLSDGTVGEVRHPGWVMPGTSSSVQERLMRLPISYQDTERGPTLRWHASREWDPRNPTHGTEFEIDVRHDNAPYRITTDGSELRYPNGQRGSFHEAGLDPEGFDRTVEYGTGVAAGWRAHRQQIEEEVPRVEEWLRTHGFDSTYLSVLPDPVSRDNITNHPWVQLIGEKMAIDEFACLSIQEHTQLASPEAGLHALMKYQGVQALFGLLTAAAPVRDGSFETTPAQHYHDDHRRPDGNTVLPEDDLLHRQRYGDEPPYDWRELSRVLGSESSGAYARAMPPDLDAFMLEADAQLRDGRTVSSIRTLGWHTDRLRLDKGTVEICNLGTAGGNVTKLTAVLEMVSKYVVALQEEYLGGHNAEAWAAEYEHAVEVGQANNYLMALSGKDTRLIGPNGQPIEPTALLAEIREFINMYSPEPLSERAYDELLATLQTPPPPGSFVSAAAVLEYFFSPKSTMTATDALRTAHAVEPDRSVAELLSLFSQERRHNVDALSRRLELRRLGSLASGRTNTDDPMLAAIENITTTLS
jgi:hypothetical protein